MNIIRLLGKFTLIRERAAYYVTLFQFFLIFLPESLFSNHTNNVFIKFQEFKVKESYLWSWNVLLEPFKESF